METRIPSEKDVAGFDGMHCREAWEKTPREWCCPGCGRSKVELMRWGRRDGGNARRYGKTGWKWSVARHHDHGNRWDGYILVCQDCNSADGRVKAVFGARDDWSSTAPEISTYITGEPHKAATIDFGAAWSIVKKDLDLKKPEAQSVSFIEFMLSHAPEVQFAAAWYGGNGKVTSVAEARSTVKAVQDYVVVAPWLKAKNAHSANVWVRPSAALGEHPLVMLDDLPIPRALAIIRKYTGAAIETSAGNAQAWIVLSRPLDRAQRQAVAASLARLVGCDSDAVSEPRWGRLPGFRQRKPGKTGWTNLLCVSSGPTLDPSPHLPVSLAPAGTCVSPPNGGRGASPGEGDQHRREFAFACHALRGGKSFDEIAASIAARALQRGKRRSPEQAARYARKTVAAALSRIK